MESLRLTIIILFIIILSYTHGFSNEKQEITIPLSIKLAVLYDPPLKRLKYDHRVYQAQFDEAQKAFYPKITTELKRSHAITFTNPSGATILTFDNSLEIPIYDRALIYKKKRSKYEILLNHIKIQKRLNDLCKEIITMYYSILNYKALAKVRKGEYTKAKESFELMKKKLKHQKALPLDVLLTRGLMLQNKYSLKSAIHDFHEERKKLLDKMNLKGNYILRKGVVNLPPTKDIEKLVQIGLSHRNEIREKQYQLLTNKSILEIEKSIFYPKVTLQSSLLLTSIDNYSLKDRLDWSLFVIISMALLDDLTLSTKGGGYKDYRVDTPQDEESVKLTLFGGTSTRANRLRAEANIRGLEDELRDLRLSIRQEITKAYNDLIEALDNLKLSRINLQIGKGLVRKAESEYKIGRKGLEDVIEAKEKDIRYKIEHQQAILKIQLSVMNLRWAIGTLWKDYL